MNESTLLKKYKNQFLIIFLFFASVAIVLLVILPQITEIRVLASKLEEQKKEVEALQVTLNVLNAITTEDIDNNYDLATSALPQVKDLLLIFNELTAASQKAGVNLGGLTINVGSVYAKNKKEELKPPIIGSPALSFLIVVNGEYTKMREFGNILYQTIPLLEIVSASISDTEGKFNANFFYNPIVFAKTDAKIPAKPLNQAETGLLVKLKEWKDLTVTESIGLFEPVISTDQNPNVSITPSPSPIIVSPTISPTL